MPDGVHLADIDNNIFQREIWGSLEAFQAREVRVFGDVKVL